MRAMKWGIVGFVVFSAFLGACTSEQSSNQLPDDALEEMSEYDSVLAKELGADDYGMRQYVMAFLKKGPNRNMDTAEAVKLQMEHLKNIGRMAEEGMLLLAGPFMDDGDIRGIYIFDVRSVKEAEELTKTDPAIQAGSLVMELHPWYGSAAVMKINEIHNQIAKISF